MKQLCLLIILSIMPPIIAADHIRIEPLAIEHIPSTISHPTRHDLFFVLLDGNAVVGSGAIRKLNDSSTWELKRLWILKDYRGLGWGKKIVALPLEYAQQHNGRRIWLDVYEPEKWRKIL